MSLQLSDAAADPVLLPVCRPGWQPGPNKLPIPCAKGTVKGAIGSYKCVVAAAVTLLLAHMIV